LLTWLLVGLGAIFYDSALQPTLKHWGEQSATLLIAQYWQSLGAGFGITAFLIAGSLLARKDRLRTVCTFGACLILTSVASTILKYLVCRARPDRVDGETHFCGPFGVFYQGPPVQMDAMPSGHTAVAFAMATALAWRWPRWKIVWFLAAVGVGVARTLVDRHFLSDVILAAWMGTLLGQWVCCRVPGRIEILIQRRKEPDHAAPG